VRAASEVEPSSTESSRRLLSVLLGATSDATRTQESLRLLNWGYQAYDSVKIFAAGDTVRTLDVWKGSLDAVKVGSKSDLYVTVPKGQAHRLKAELLSAQPLIAPIKQGQEVGTLRVLLDDQSIGEFRLVTLEPVGQAGLLGRLWDTLRLWIK